MSWFDGKILSELDVTEGAFETPSEFQVGDSVHLWVMNDVAEPVPLPAFVETVHIGRNHTISYDLAFRIGNTAFYSVARNMRGSITAIGQPYPGEDGGLVNVDDLCFRPSLVVHQGNATGETNPTTSSLKPTLTVVPTE